MQTSLINLQINLESMQKNTDINGEIFFSIREIDFYFPEKNWDDFVITILNWWFDSAIRLNSFEGEVSEILNFMDGPFFVKINKKSSDILKFSFIYDRRDAIEVEKIIYVSLKQFQDDLLNITFLLLKDLKLKGWLNEEIEELEKRYKILKRMNSNSQT